MATLTLKIVYGVNEGLAISASELMEQYLFGISTCVGDGRTLPAASILAQVRAAQSKIENLFSIKFNKQVINESRDFIREEFDAWGHVRSMYPIMYIDRLRGYINQATQINYPHEWLQIKRQTSVATYRNLQLIPNSASPKGAYATANSLIYNGISPHLAWFGNKFIPNYWRILYITGWDKVPDDLLDFMAKFAAINVLAIIGSYLYGVGLTSINITLDGVSQNLPLNRGNKYGILGDRIQLYMDQINQCMPAMYNQYRGIPFEVL